MKTHVNLAIVRVCDWAIENPNAGKTLALQSQNPKIAQ
jgi:hypothetical protein